METAVAAPPASITYIPASQSLGGSDKRCSDGKVWARIHIDEQGLRTLSITPFSAGEGIGVSTAYLWEGRPIHFLCEVLTHKKTGEEKIALPIEDILEISRILQNSPEEHTIKLDPKGGEAQQAWLEAQRSAAEATTEGFAPITESPPA